MHNSQVINDDCCLRTTPIKSSQGKLSKLRKKQMNFRETKSEKDSKKIQNYRVKHGQNFGFDSIYFF